MILQESRQQVSAISNTVKQKISHGYLQKHIDVPSVDEDRILLLLSCIGDSGLAEEKRNTYIVTAMLVQIALDTHEKIKNENDVQKKQQLTVLAGDYYSGLYYQILSEEKDILLIRAFASGIQIVNECKISVYRQESKQLDHFFDHIRKMESAIINSLLEFLGRTKLSKLYEELLLLKRLLLEMEKFKNGEHSVVFAGLNNFAVSKRDVPLNSLTAEDRADLLNTCESYIDKTKSLIGELMRNAKALPPVIKGRIVQLASREAAVQNLYAEEG